MASLNDDERAELDRFLDEIAQATGGTLHAYPRPGRAVRSIVLRDIHDDNGSQHEAAQLEDDGTLRVAGHDQGPALAEFFGDGVTSYEWVYVIAPDKVSALVRVLGGHDSDDALALLAAYHQHTQGKIYDLLTGPDPPSSAPGTAKHEHHARQGGDDDQQNARKHQPSA